jgi:hypothetical protein
MTRRAAAPLVLACVALACAAAPAAAQQNSARVVCDGAPVQGGFLICTAAATAAPPLAMNGGDPQDIEENGFAFFPIDRDATGMIEVRGHGLQPYAAEIGVREFDIQSLSLPPSEVAPRTPEEQAKVAADAVLKNRAWAHEARGAGWLDGFVYPLEKQGVTQSGVYGSQRILNGEPGNPHFGIDYAAATGDAIVAPAPGVVALADPDMYFEGGFVVLNHGAGVMSVFMHMSEVDVQAGQRVSAGDRLGAVGDTGRATGAHLHWGVRVRGTYVDPELLMAFKPRESESLMPASTGDAVVGQEQAGGD